jgi:NAD(P)-dependent dehydrogenase (short-subunit alcohol dehydrogenase family)
MDLQLTDHVAIVTGASRGIGRAIAETLAGEGMHVVLAARSRETLEAIAGALSPAPFVQALDLREPDAPGRVVRATLARFGRLDLLVNNAGDTKRGDFLALTEDDWRGGFGLKFDAARRACHAAWPHLRATRGSIVNIAGLGGRVASAEFTIGGAVNAAMINLTKALADRGVRDGIRVNAINPGSIGTDRLQARIQTFAGERQVSRDEAAVQLARTLGIARFGEPAEIARLVAFLASPLAAFCQGAIIDADGGQNRAV